MERGHLEITLASDKDAREWSNGEVTLSETINYRTFKPYAGGLFCERIFGPMKDYECACGTYSTWQSRGTVCEKCGVLVGPRALRRERMGHIELALPIVHIWYFAINPSVLGSVLDMSKKELEAIIYCDTFVVTQSNVKEHPVGKRVSREAYLTLLRQHQGRLTMETGANAVKFYLQQCRFELPLMLERCHKQLFELPDSNDFETTRQRRRLAQRIKVLEMLVESKADITNVVKRVIPVIPAELRPMSQLDDGRFATFDLNELYKAIILSNDRLKRMLSMNAPPTMILDEQALLQKNVDSLFDNQRSKKKASANNGRALKSLSDKLNGKKGVFRSNLLGKRVDYSGRSVIVVGPHLKMTQCGLPKLMALELFKPFVVGRLVRDQLASSVNTAKTMVERQATDVWDVLSEVTRENVVLLNRAPTLHKLGIQAFEPVLIDGKAIQLHPLVCVAFNADFDGDLMAVHVPMTREAQREARKLMMPSKNIRSPASGEPIMVPNQDIVLGLYYMTQENPSSGRERLFASAVDLRQAYDAEVVALNERVRVRIGGETHATTPGRVLLYEHTPSCVAFDSINRPLAKNDIVAVIDSVYTQQGEAAAAGFVDKLMEVGLEFATQSGCSISIKDFDIPGIKYEVIDQSFRKLRDNERSAANGLMTASDLTNSAVNIWTETNEVIAEHMMSSISEFKDGQYNSVWIYADSGARGSASQIQQMAGMRGLLSRPDGSIMETPITSNFREGLNIDEYFLSTHGTRKGLCDTALKTSKAGYLTRRLVDTAQDVVITEADCGTANYIEIGNRILDGDVNEPVSMRVLGRTLAKDIEIQNGVGTLIEAGTVVTLEVERLLADYPHPIAVRSPVLCDAEYGICAKCYGANIATGEEVQRGEPVGIIAAQSIGEPGTQLTLRTFHTGGSAQGLGGGDAGFISARNDGAVRVQGSVNNNVVFDRNGSACVSVVDSAGTELERHPLPYGAILQLEDGAEAHVGDTLALYDGSAAKLLAPKDGTVSYHNDGPENIEVRVDELTGVEERVTHSYNPELPLILRLTWDTDFIDYRFPDRATLLVDEGAAVTAGDELARFEKRNDASSLRTKDIVGGLDKVDRLFECRKPKFPRIVAPVDGVAEIYEREHCQLVQLNDQAEGLVEVPLDRQLLFYDGEHLQAGDVIADGEPDLNDVLNVFGIERFTEFMVDEIQQVYRRQGIALRDIHIEVIVRQMIQSVEVTSPGLTRFVVGEKMTFRELMRENKRVQTAGGAPAEFKRSILGLTDKSKSSDSFICAASFRETSKALATASLSNRVDPLRGIKENVICGNLIPAGTGFA